MLKIQYILQQRRNLHELSKDYLKISRRIINMNFCLTIVAIPLDYSILKYFWEMSIQSNNFTLPAQTNVITKNRSYRLISLKQTNHVLYWIPVHVIFLIKSPFWQTLAKSKLTSTKSKINFCQTRDRLMQLTNKTDSARRIPPEPPRSDLNYAVTPTKNEIWNKCVRDYLFRTQSIDIHKYQKNPQLREEKKYFNVVCTPHISELTINGSIKAHTSSSYYFRKTFYRHPGRFLFNLQKRSTPPRPFLFISNYIIMWLWYSHNYNWLQLWSHYYLLLMLSLSKKAFTGCATCWEFYFLQFKGLFGTCVHFKVLYLTDPLHTKFSYL